jgi:hypothetical protein
MIPTPKKGLKENSNTVKYTNTLQLSGKFLIKKDYPHNRFG